MNQNWDVFLGEKKIGTADVVREGLYYHFRCKCHLPETEMYTIQVCCNGNRRNLGIYVPTERYFGLETKVPSKYIGEGMFEFRAIPKYDHIQEQFYPIVPAEPFKDLKMLENAYFCVINGRPGLCIKD